MSAEMLEQLVVEAESDLKEHRELAIQFKASFLLLLLLEIPDIEINFFR